jgi:hypothetical protein
MNQPHGTNGRVIIDCPCCVTKVAVPVIARGSMAKCGRCGSAFRIPLEDDPMPSDENQADDLAIEILEQPDDEDDATVVMDSVQEDEFKPPEPATLIDQVDARAKKHEQPADDDPPDIGDGSTPEEVKQLRRERHKLLLEVGREAYEQILSSTFEQFQAKIRKIDKGMRRIRAWVEAVHRANSQSNPLARKMDMNVDSSRAAKQLAELERDYKHAMRVLGEALFRSGQHPKICVEQRDRLKVIDAKLDELVPLPQKKGLLARFRNR